MKESRPQFAVSSGQSFGGASNGSSRRRSDSTRIALPSICTMDGFRETYGPELGDMALVAARRGLVRSIRNADSYFYDEASLLCAASKLFLTELVPPNLRPGPEPQRRRRNPYLSPEFFE